MQTHYTRVSFAALTLDGRVKALRLWQPNYFTGSDDYRHLALADWQALVMAHWMAVSVDEFGFCDDESGRAY